MSSKGLRCSRCDIPLDPGTERCPRCLRQSSVIDLHAPKRVDRAPERVYVAAAPGGGATEPGDRPPKHVGIRIAALAVAWAACAPVVWLILGNEPWLEARGLWLSACVTAVGLGSLPLRMAFAPPESAISPRAATRHYFWLMAAAVAMSLAFGAGVAAAARVTDNPLYALGGGLLLFLLLLLCGPVVVGAWRQRKPAAEVLRALARNAALAVAIVCLGGALVWLRSLKSHDARPTLYLPEDPTGLLDPLDLQHVPVRSSRTLDAERLWTVHLAADGGDIRRSLGKLSVEIVLEAGKMRGDASVNGQIRGWLPARLRTAENEQAAREEERSLREAMRSGSLRTGGGRPIEVTMEFGELPLR
jgi:hypothetical protein